MALGLLLPVSSFLRRLDGHKEVEAIKTRYEQADNEAAKAWNQGLEMHDTKPATDQAFFVTPACQRSACGLG